MQTQLRPALARWIGVAVVLMLVSTAASRAQPLGSQDACSDGSLRGLTVCLPQQITLSQMRLEALFQQKLARSHGEDRERLTRAETAWDAYVGPECDWQGAQAGLQPDWTAVAVLQCRLDLTNARVALLMR